jgi:hypothetical protein
MSSSYTATTSYSTTQLVYGSATLDGVMAADTVCLSAGAGFCAEDFAFFMIQSQTGLYGLDGILGLSPTTRTDPSFIWNLYKGGQVAEPVVTFWVND